MMNRAVVKALLVALLLSGEAVAEGQSLHVGPDAQEVQVQAQRSGNLNVQGYQRPGHHDGYGNGRHEDGYQTDVVVDLPPEAWQTRQNGNQPPCLRCCTYENRSYTEGSVVKMEGVLLQCRRDEQSIGTNNLIWQTVK